MELVKVKGKEIEEFQEDGGQSIARTVIKRRFLLNIAQLALPYFIFTLNFMVVGYTILYPNYINVVSCSIFFIFSLIFVKFYGKIKE
jgi:hypothetical protein